MCSIDGCPKPRHQRGWCSAHYNRWWRNGDPLKTARPTFGMTAEQAFRHYMPEPPPPAPSPTEGCWPWRGPAEQNGYGSYKANKGRNIKAHRQSYELFVDHIPPGRLIRHTCDTPLCVQPAHLIPGTDADNNRDMMERGRNAQPHGSKHGYAKLTEAQVAQIRLEYAAGGITQRELGERFGVDQTCISTVVRRKNWTHVR